jgi:cytochrome P450
MSPLDLESMITAGPIAPIEDPYSLYARLRREAPVKRMNFPARPTFFVSRFDDVHTVLKDHPRFSNRSNERGIGMLIGRTIIGMDGPEHQKHRALITPALVPRALSGSFPELVSRIAHEIIDGFAARGSADLVADFTYLYPIRVFTELLGLDPVDVARFHDWAVDLSHVVADPARGVAASVSMREHLGQVLRERKREPGGGLIGSLLTAEVNGERISDEEVINFVCLLMIAGAETTYHLMGSALYALLHDADLFARVRADPERIPPVLDETLRWESPVQILTREALEDVELAGTKIPAGSDVIVGIGSANRDERRFPDPDRFDADREGEVHIAFGFGRHYCAGSRLAILEARIGLEAVFERFPDLRLDPEAERARILGVAFRSPDRLRVCF